MKKEKKICAVADALDIPIDAVCDLPVITIMGKSEVNIENSRGIIEYTNNCFRINTLSGIVKIEGDELMIKSITDESICVRGIIIRVEVG